jgi:hypothetical protein
MQGMCDFMWMLDRGDESKTASLKGRGRDIEDFEYALKWNPETWKYENTGKLWEVVVTENRQQIIEAMKIFAHEKQQLEVRPNEIAAFIGETGIKAKSRIQKTMQRMVESNDLLKGSEFGTYKIFSQLPIKTNNINFEVDKIN